MSRLDQKDVDLRRTIFGGFVFASWGWFLGIIWFWAIHGVRWQIAIALWVTWFVILTFTGGAKNSWKEAERAVRG